MKYLLLTWIFISQAYATTRGNIAAKVISYTDSTVPNYGQQTKAELEQSTVIKNNVKLFNQLRWLNNSINSDLSTKSTPVKKDSYEVYLGENYVSYKTDGLITQIGYQEVVWGESFGFNYADLINPKDKREVLLTDAASARLPLLMVNAKKLFTINSDYSGSLQLIYSPEPRFSKNLPIDFYIGSQFPQAHFHIIKEKSPQFFTESEFGGKMALSFYGFDTSLGFFSYLDRDPTFTLESMTATNITLKEIHQKNTSYLFSLSKTISDFVFRSDFVITQDKKINYIENNSLKSFDTTMTNFLISLDTPTYNNFSGVIIYAESDINTFKLGSFRKQNERYSILKITRQFENEKNLEMSYTHEFESTGHSLMTVFNWPITSNTELRAGGQISSGENESNLNKFKKINSIFFSIKNYFTL